jgi:phosphoribosyl 1,2-cyclic phosphate phosphodiesterase
MQPLNVTILGCGASGGVPLIGCDCAVCLSTDLKNKRTRSSILVEGAGTRLLIDTSPDLRQQALRAAFATVDGILFTHDHADHLHGLDDARSFNFHRKGSLPIYSSEEFLKSIADRFPYVLGGPAGPDGVWMKPSLVPHEIKEYDYFSVGNLKIQSFLQHHGKGKSLGYRIGNFAYSTDVDNFPDESLQLLEKLDVWVVDCLRYSPAPTHAHLEKTLGWIERFKPRLSIVTHMAHELEYSQLLSELPPNVVPAYDGLQIAVAGA